MTSSDSEAADAHPAPASKRRRILIGLLVAGGLVYFTVRGPARALRPGGSLDFHFLLTAIETFQEGRNPYLREDIEAVAAAHGRNQFIPRFLNATLLYPPPFVTLFYPFGLISEEAGRWIWLALQLAALAGLVIFPARLFGLNRIQQRWLALAALYAAPVHTSLAHGQPAILFCCLAAMLFVFLRERRTVAAGLTLGLLMIKTSFGVPALVPAFALGGVRVLAIGALLNALAWTPMIARYGVVESVGHYAGAVERVQAPGQDADDSRANRYRFDLLNLRSWLFSWALPPVVVNPLTLGAVLLSAGLLWRFRGIARDGPASPYYWTLAAAFSLLAVYHRFYDAAILVLAAAASCREWEHNRRRALWLAVPLGLFVVPGTSFLRLALGEAAESSVWVEALVVRHQPPAVAAVAAAAAVFLWQDRRKA